MLKLFNRKTMVIYIALVIIFAVLGSSLIGVNIHYRKAFVEATKSGNELSDKIVKGISTVLQNLVKQKTGTDTDLSGNNNDKQEPEYDDATKAIMHKRDTSFAFIFVSYALMAVFAGFAIAAGEYPKYLEGDKYKAKLRRLEKAKKAAEIEQ